MSLSEVLPGDYAELTREGYVFRHFSVQEIGDRWREEIRKKCRADKIAVRTYSLDRGVLAELRDLVPSPEQEKERMDDAREKLEEFYEQSGINTAAREWIERHEIERFNHLLEHSLERHTVNYWIEDGKGRFRCPLCSRKLTVDAVYVFSFLHKLCPKCRISWTNDSAPNFDDRRDLPDGPAGTISISGWRRDSRESVE